MSLAHQTYTFLIAGEVDGEVVAAVPPLEVVDQNLDALFEAGEEGLDYVLRGELVCVIPQLSAARAYLDDIGRDAITAYEAQRTFIAAAQNGFQ